MLRRPPKSPLFPYTTLSDLLKHPGHCSGSSKVTAVLGKSMADLRDGAVAIVSHRLDRKSTRLNSSHPSISYAVFCLKKKTATTGVSAPTSGLVVACGPGRTE